MNAIDRVLQKMRRQWILEHAARRSLLVIGVAVNLALLCWLLNRLAGLPLWSLYAVGGIAVAGLAALILQAQTTAPAPAQLAKLADDRAGTEDLFSSALEFQAQPDRFGWLGAATCDLALQQAVAAKLPPRWTLGRRRDWWFMSSAASVLVLGILAVIFVQRQNTHRPPEIATNSPAPRIVIAAKSDDQAPPPEKAPVATTLPAALPEPDSQPADKAPDATVKITRDMVDKYLDQMPGQDKVDLTGVTPIRWDQDETTGKNNPQDQNTQGEKVDPVKLDAALLKDLQVAKKTKDTSGAGGKDGGVSIAVMGNDAGLKAKGNQGGKGNKESLADAVSKDPRGEPSRMAQRPQAKALPIRSSEKLPTRAKGEDRPMTPLDFAGALDRMKLQPPEVASTDVKTLDKPQDHIVRQEAVADPAAALTESYFDLLRKADR